MPVQMSILARELNRLIRSQLRLVVRCYLLMRRTNIWAEFHTAKIRLTPQRLTLALAFKTGRQTSIKKFEN